MLANDKLGNIEVICPNCGRLGIFYLSPEQHRAGALARAERLADKHVHPGVLINEAEND